MDKLTDPQKTEIEQALLEAGQIIRAALPGDLQTAFDDCQFLTYFSLCAEYAGTTPEGQRAAGESLDRLQRTLKAWSNQALTAPQ